MDSMDAEALFVEIESYESMRAKAEMKDRALQKLLNRVKTRDEKLKQAQQDLQGGYTQVLILKKDLGEVVVENEKIKTKCEELTLERDGLSEVN